MLDVLKEDEKKWDHSEDKITEDSNQFNTVRQITAASLELFLFDEDSPIPNVIKDPFNFQYSKQTRIIPENEISLEEKVIESEGIIEYIDRESMFVVISSENGDKIIGSLNSNELYTGARCSFKMLEGHSRVTNIQIRLPNN